LTIPVNIDRLNRAVQEINSDRHLNIPYKNRLRCGPAHNILERMNALREQNYEFHSALQHAAAAEPRIGSIRKALYRKVISLYGRWTYKALRKAGYRGPELAFYAGSELSDTEPVGGTVALNLNEKSGQYGFIK
jgi:hypothetical protein